MDQLKIDRSFVQELANGSSDAAICAATIDLARNLHFKVIAEGVETDAQREYLKAIGCDFMQGYLVSKPLPPSEFVAFSRKKWGSPSPISEQERPVDLWRPAMRPRRVRGGPVPGLIPS
jgi:EAL domain-containing protein (putative c-di-GMP-specific phosphodiesterase class I)